MNDFSLFDIHSYILSIENLYEEGQLSEQEYKDSLEGWKGARDEKLAGLCAIIKKFDSYRKVCEIEAEQLAEKAKQWGERVESRKRLLALFLNETPWTDGKHKASFHKSVSINPDYDQKDIDELPAEFIREKTTREVDKVKLRHSLESGASYGRFRLQKKTTLSVR